MTDRRAQPNMDYEENLVELIDRLAAKGRDDPTIAGVLGITAAKVQRIRTAHEIPAGERRWLPAAATGGEADA